MRPGRHEDGIEQSAQQAQRMSLPHDVHALRQRAAAAQAECFGSGFQHQHGYAQCQPVAWQALLAPEGCQGHGGEQYIERGQAAVFLQCRQTQQQCQPDQCGGPAQC